MLLQRLLDPEEAVRRRRLRARIVRRNRIKRELEQGLEPKLRRVPKPAPRTIHDYGWDPLQDAPSGSATSATTGNALAFLVQGAAASPARETDAFIAGSRLRTPILEGADAVAPRFASRQPVPSPMQRGAVADDAASSSLSPMPGRVAAARRDPKARAARPRNDALALRWRGVLQRILIQRHDEILRKDPQRQWRQERLGLLLFERGEYARASEHLTMALTLGSTRSVCWRRLAQSHLYRHDATHDWDLLWDAKAAFEQALRHVDMACNPYVLVEYARVLELLGGYDAALTANAALLSTFPRFARLRDVQIRFVLLQRYQLHVHGDALPADEQQRMLLKCIELTKALLLDKEIAGGPRYGMVLYMHARLHELLGAAATRTGGAGEVARTARSGADQAWEELFKVALALRLTTPAPGRTWKVWRTQSDTFVRWAEHFQQHNETIPASDALARALELMDETPPASAAATLPATVAVAPPLPLVGLSPVDAKKAKALLRVQQERQRALERRRKIELYLVMARNYYDGNQMERAIRAMETVFQLDPFLAQVRQSLVDWFPAKWKDRIELEDASQVQIARVLRGAWGRTAALARRRSVERAVETAYRAHPYQPLHRRNVVRLLKAKYASRFAAQELAARRIQKSARLYLKYARLRWAQQDAQANRIRDLRAKHATRKYRYNRTVRFQLAQLVPLEFAARFRAEERGAARIQRWFRGERVRCAYRAARAAKLAQLQREVSAATRIQRAYRGFKSHTQALTLLHADELLFQAQRRLQLARERLAAKLQRMYRQWKDRLVLLARVQIKQAQRQKLDVVRDESAARIQRAWRHHVALQSGDPSANEAKLLVEQLRRGHERLLAHEQAAAPRTRESSARQIQAAYRGKRIRASLANIRRVPAPPSPSELAELLRQCERNHMTGEEKRVELAQLASVKEKRALFDFPVVILSPSSESEPVALTHLTSAIQHSAQLRCLALLGGAFRVEELFQAVQTSKTMRVLALGAIRPRRRRRGSDPPKSQNSPTPTQADEALVQTHLASPEPEVDDDNSDSSDDDDDLDPAGTRRQLGPRATPMRALANALRTKNFLLEELYLEGNSLLRRASEGAVLAEIVGDYFYGRYGRLTKLVAATMELSDDSAAPMGAALAINTVLCHLNLSMNDVRDAGAAAIARLGLSANHSLVYLNLADNAVGSAGATALFQSLETHNRTLRTLLLTNNLIMNDAVAPLLAAWQRNAVVERIELRGNLLHDDHLLALDRAMHERGATANAELRLFLARRRFSRDSAPRALSPVASPGKRTGSLKQNGKRLAAPLSPHKWIKSAKQHAENAHATSSPLIRAPLSVFRQPQQQPQQQQSPLQHATRTRAVPHATIDALLLPPSPSRTRQKPAHDAASPTKLPTLSPTRIAQAQRR